MQEQESNTGKRDEVRINSGLPVSHPGPGQGRTHTPTTSGRKPGAFPPTPPPLPKGGRESEGSALSGGAGGEAHCQRDALSLSSLVSNKNNRYTQQPQGRGKYCARWTLKGVDLRTPVFENTFKRYLRVNCNCWDCSYCGPIKAKRYKAAIRQNAETYGLNKFLTLTLDPKKIPEGGSISIHSESLCRISCLPV